MKYKIPRLYIILNDNLQENSIEKRKPLIKVIYPGLFEERLTCKDNNYNIFIKSKIENLINVKNNCNIFLIFKQYYKIPYIKINQANQDIITSSFLSVLPYNNLNYIRKYYKNYTIIGTVSRLSPEKVFFIDL